MELTDEKKCLESDKGRFFQVFAILTICSIISITIELSDSFFPITGLISNSSIWYYPLTFLTVFISLSTFIIAFITYPQAKNFKMLVAGYTFFTVGLLNWLSVFGSLNFPVLNSGGETSEKTILIRMTTGLFNLIGFSALLFLKEESKRVVKRIFPLLMSLVSVFLSFSAISYIPLDRVFTNSEGLTLSGIVPITVISFFFIYTFYISIKKYKKTGDILYRILACAFLLMFFSDISLLNIRQAFGIRSLLSYIYQFVSYVILFNVFYVHGIKRPYILLTKTKEELNGYLAELDELVDKRTTELRCINEKLIADQETARGIQLSMLPSILPKNEYAAFSSGYVPAEKLSGDFYNVFKIDETRFGICIGDVSGHGVSAAMLSIFTFQKMQSLLEEEGGEGMAIPSLVLKNLYDSFNAANFNDDMYIVMLYGVFDYTSGIFSYASGGLNTVPLRVRPDGSIQELDNDGFAICKLGDILKPKFVNHQILLFPGDKLILYTDGLTDARNPDDERYSLKRLKKAILCHYKWGTDHLIDAILRDIKNYAGEKPADDVTLLAIDVLLPF